MKLEELQNIISKKISDEISVDYINVYDYTAQHENHATFEGNYHLSMTLVSPDFESIGARVMWPDIDNLIELIENQVEVVLCFFVVRRRDVENRQIQSSLY